MVGSVQEIPGIASSQEKVYQLSRMFNIIGWPAAYVANVQKLAIG